mgnify:CR=1 FL=1
MVKRIGRRFVSLLLTFVTILTMLPAMTLPALAATDGNLSFPDSSIGLSFSGNADKAWKVDGTTITGSATSTSGTCEDTPYESNLTITNNMGADAVLSFNYIIAQSGGTIKVDEKAVDKNGSLSKNLPAGQSVKVYIKSGSAKDDTKITITDIKLVPVATATVTFQPAENGNYTVNGQKITGAHTITQSSAKSYQVVATPDEGYQFLGWYDDTNKIYLRGGASSDIHVSSDTSEVTAKFGLIGTNFQVQVGTSNLIWDDLNDAIISTRNNSSGYIKQLESCTISGKYTIPTGVTLLIPFNKDGTVYTTTPAFTTTAEPQKAYKTLTMAAGSSITVNGGAISVGGKHFAGSAGSCCKTTGPYGQIIMQEGSAIRLNSGANLYAWGYITGDGKITAADGATVYEYFQVADWRGGTATSSMILVPNQQQVFPFSQYYVQNIEAPLTIQNGATEKAYFSVDSTFGAKSVTIDFIGSNKSLFRLGDGGTLTKKYDPSTDRITYTTTGKASLDSLNLSVSKFNIDSTNYVLPVNNNMTLEILSGSVAVNCNAALLPGAQITIAQGAELSVSDGKSLYVYDQDQWGPYCSGAKEFVPVPYTPTPKGTRTLANATINVNGTLTAAGSVYTTQSGADICSSEGGGRFVQQNAPGNKETTHQATQNNKSISYADIPITPAQLLNNDGSYTPTAGSNAGDTFTYCTCPRCGGKWDKIPYFAAICNSDGTQTGIYPTLQDAVNNYTPDSNTYIKLLHDTTENIDSPKNLCLDLNGCTVTGDFKMNGNTLNGMDSSASKGYDTAPSGKIVGAVSRYARTYETPPVDGEYDRYVAILGQDQTLSFHHFNISVTGYRFELAAPQCALIFCGKFQGDDAAKGYLKSLGFTLTGNNGPVSKSSKMSDALRDGYVKEDPGAYLFELYLIRSFEKNSSDKTAYTEEFSATAQATFKNGGTQDSGTQDSGTQNSGTKDSKPQKLSFLKAWTDAWKNPEGLDDAQKTALDNFLNALDIPHP